jgi:hypothetical protein
MRRFTIFSIAVFLVVAQLAFAGDLDRYEKTDWKAFSKNLVKALTLDNKGVKVAAMQNMITYSKYLNVEDATFDLIRIYRYNDNQKIRQLAVVALHHVGNNWAMDFLKRSIKFEENETIKRQIVDCLLSKKDDLALSENEVKDLLAILEK